MTSPMMESRVNREFPVPVSPTDCENSGFPFDRDERDRSFQTELEDIAVRHPEFAEHLHPFHAGSPRRTSGQDPFAEYRTFRDRPFGSRFEQFGFPFAAEFDEDPRFFRQTYQTQQQPQTSSSTDKVPEESSGQKVQEKPPQAPKSEDRGRKPNSHIHQSNTVDLGQKQEPVDDNRNQRSMSAPPENRSNTGKRFVSSINIPNLNVGAGDMGGRMSQPQDANPQPQPQPQPTAGKPTERIIPIHIEGRDEPVIPRNVNTSFSSAPPPQPQPDRLFGQRPSTFTQFVNRDDPQTSEDAHRQQEEMMRQQYQNQQQEYQRQQQENFQRQQEKEAPPQQQPQPPQPQQQTQKPTPLDLIQVIQKDVSKLMEQVDKFEGKPRDKLYLYLDEMLTRNLLKLDNIETEGKDAIRQARKEAIKCIEQCIQLLENKANDNEMKEKAAGKTKAEDSGAKGNTHEAKDEKMDVEAKEPVQTVKAVEAVMDLGQPDKEPSPQAVAKDVEKESTNSDCIKEQSADRDDKGDVCKSEPSEVAAKSDNIGEASQAETKEDNTEKKVKKKSEKK